MFRRGCGVVPGSWGLPSTVLAPGQSWGAWPGWCQHGRQASQSELLGRRLDSELGYFKLTVASIEGPFTSSTPAAIREL